MKKIIIWGFILSLFLWQSFAADSYISKNCETKSNKMICSNYKSYQDKVDNLIQSIESKYSDITLKVKLKLLTVKIKTLQQKFKSQWKYKWWVEFILEYMNYKINNILDNTWSDDSSSSIEDGSNDIGWKIYIDSLPNTISLKVWSKKADFLKFKIINESDKDIYLSSFDLSGDLEAFNTNTFRLNYDNLSKTLSNLSVKIPKSSEKQFILNWDMASTFSGKFSLILEDFTFKDSEWKIVDYTTDNPSIKWDYEIGSKNYVTETSSTPVEDPASSILSSTDEITVASYKLRVKYMDCLIKELTLVNIWTGTQTQVSSSNYNSYNGADNNVDKVYLYTSSGKKLWQATMLNWLVNFQFSDPVVVPVNEDFYLVVKIKLNKVSGINNTNKFIKFGMLTPGDSINKNWWTYTTNIVTKNTWVQISWVYIWSFDGSVGNLQVVRKSNILVSSLTQTNHALVSNTWIFGFSATSQWQSSPAIKEFRFNVYVYNSSSSSNNFKILWNSFELNINWSRISSNDVKFYNTLGSCKDLWWDSINWTSDLTYVDSNNYQYCVKAVFGWNYSNWYSLTPDKTYEFKINANPVNFGNYSSVNAGFDDISTYNVNDTYTNISKQNTSFVWSDNSADYLNTSLSNRFTDWLMNLYNVETWYIGN